VRKLARQLVDFIREDFDPVVYGGTAVLLTALCVANYQYDAFAPLLRNTRSPLKIVNYVLFYGAPWLGVLILQALRGRLTHPPAPAPGTPDWAVNRGVDLTFLPAAAAALFIVSFTDWFPYHNDFRKLIAARELQPWVRPIIWNLKSTTTWIVPMATWWVLRDRSRNVPFLYGLTREGFDIRPYLMCLSVIVPLVTWASFQPAFLDMYPTYKPWKGVEAYLGVHPWVTVLPYELVYGFDFAFVEMYFRGFLIIGLARWLGTNAVLPMVAMYAVLHFGKPFPETVGSIFGGYILGVFALRSGSILGGVLLHLGVAWSMEATAMAQHWWRG
jgi:hypothetical protein